MKNLFYSIFAVSVIALLCSCDKKDQDPVESGASIVGTWELVSCITPEGIETSDEGIREIFCFNEDGSGYYQVIDNIYDHKDQFDYQRTGNTLLLTYSQHEQQFSITKLNNSELNLYYVDNDDEDGWYETYILKRK